MRLFNTHSAPFSRALCAFNSLCPIFPAHRAPSPRLHRRLSSSTLHLQLALPPFSRALCAFNTLRPIFPAHRAPSTRLHRRLSSSTLHLQLALPPFLAHSVPSTRSAPFFPLTVRLLLFCTTAFPRPLCTSNSLRPFSSPTPRLRAQFASTPRLFLAVSAPFFRDIHTCPSADDILS
ncbi:MAG: hypothetical protein K0R67_218 [Paenibacillus sp.]|jgi:hypothetical protein|nr:hypothetical protein [Paenibacillus sp.]